MGPSEHIILAEDGVAVSARFYVNAHCTMRRIAPCEIGAEHEAGVTGAAAAVPFMYTTE